MDVPLRPPGICVPQTGLNGNISVDPLFENPAFDDYHLESGSPAMDRGDSADPNLPATDFEGNVRLADSDVDMGAYEAASSVGSGSTTSQSPAQSSSVGGGGGGGGGCFIATVAD
jgi:hypothetical protein